jgi:adenosine deaminase
MNIHTLPKIELHLHLDCCLSYEVVRCLAPDVTPEVCWTPPSPTI